MSKSMRITGGEARGIPLLCPKGESTRPATDSLRQAVFSSLGPLCEDALFLDLFAGTGSYGLETLSRGAKGGIFVEKNRLAVISLQQNIANVVKSLRLASLPCQIKPVDVTQLTLPDSQRFDLIFLDPPYSLTRQSGNRLLEEAARYLNSHNNARLIYEAPSEYALTPPETLSCIRTLGKESGQNQPCAHIFALR